MSQAQLSVIYDGPALDGGLMEVADLAPALLGIAEACQRANRIINGSDTSLSVQARADLKSGCFHVDLDLGIIWATLGPVVSQMNQVLPIVREAQDIADVMFDGKNSVVGIIKRLAGKNPQEEHQEKVIRRQHKNYYHR